MARLAPLALAVLLVLGSAARSTAADVTVRLIYHGATDKRVVALTFDDGYSATNCALILDILERRHVAATFFPYAYSVSAAPAFWRRVAADGFPIANHTVSHPDMTLLTLDQATAEISGARRALEKITGHEMIRVFRPPYGAWNKTVIEAARDAGFPTVLLWDVDSNDWSDSATTSSVLRAALRGRNGSVVLMHCGPSVTPTILEQVIDGYEQRGFGFVTVPQLLSDAVPATAFPDPAVTSPPAEAPEPAATPLAAVSPTASVVTIGGPQRCGYWAI